MKAIERMTKFVAILIGVFGMAIVHAQITLDITKGVDGGGIPISVAPFGGGAPEDVAGIIASDLKRTGKFAPQSAGSRADYSVTGQAAPGGARGYVVQFQLSGAQGGQLLNLSFDVPANQLRPVAHRISDLIYEKLTGEKGLASTRIAYVAGGGGTWYLIVADADGQNPRAILRSSQPITNPPAGGHGWQACRSRCCNRAGWSFPRIWASRSSCREHSLRPSLHGCPSPRPPRGTRRDFRRRGCGCPSPAHE